MVLHYGRKATSLLQVLPLSVSPSRYLARDLPLCTALSMRNHRAGQGVENIADFAGTSVGAKFSLAKF